MQKLQWHPINDFSFILGVSGYTFGFVVKRRLAAQDASTTTSRRRARSRARSTTAPPATAPAPHLLIEELAADAKVQLNHVPVQGQRRPDAGPARRPRDGGQRRHAAGTSSSTAARCACSSPSARSAPSAGRNVPTAKDLGYDVVGELAVRPGRPEGHGPGGGEDAARRVQEGDGRPQAPGDCSTSSTRTSGTAAARTMQDGRVETFAKDKALIERLRAGGLNEPLDETEHTDEHSIRRPGGHRHRRGRRPGPRSTRWPWRRAAPRWWSTTSAAPSTAQATDARPRRWCAEIEAAGGEAMANGASVTDEAGVAAMVADTMDALGPHRHPGQQRRHPARQELRQDGRWPTSAWCWTCT